jgi:hypothetical protein
MTYWEKYISEEMTAAQKKKAAEGIMDDLTGKISRIPRSAT